MDGGFLVFITLIIFMVSVIIICVFEEKEKIRKQEEKIRKQNLEKIRKQEEKEKITLLLVKKKANGKQFVFTFQLKVYTKLPSNILLELRSNDYFQGASIRIPHNHIIPFAPAKELKLTADLKKASDRKLQKQCTFLLKDMQSRWCQEFPINLRVYDYIEGNEDLNQPGNLNILIFGWSGIGKSSFINTVAITLAEKEDEFHSPAHTGDSNSDNTIFFGDYRFKNICLWDTMGLAYEKYRNSEVKEILAGNVTAGQSMLKVLKTEPGECRDATTESRMHTVLLFIAADTVDEAHKMKEYKRIIDEFKTIYHLPSPLIVLTNLDKVTDVKSFICETNIKNIIEKDSKLKEIRKKVSELCGGINSVFFLFNYQYFGEQRKRNFEIERYCWHILKAAIYSGMKTKTSIENDYAKRVQKTSEKNEYL